MSTPSSPNGPTQAHVYSDVQLKFIGFLLACALGLLGWGFNNWSKAVENGMTEVMDTIQRMDARAERRDQELKNLTIEIYTLRERQNNLRERIQKQEDRKN